MISVKESAGEANMTIITIVLIGIVLAVGIPLVTNLLNNTSSNSDCLSNGGHIQNGQCVYD